MQPVHTRLPLMENTLFFSWRSIYLTQLLLGHFLWEEAASTLFSQRTLLQKNLPHMTENEAEKMTTSFCSLPKKQLRTVWDCHAGREGKTEHRKGRPPLITTCSSPKNWYQSGAGEEEEIKPSKEVIVVSVNIFCSASVGKLSHSELCWKLRQVQDL